MSAPMKKITIMTILAVFQFFCSPTIEDGSLNHDVKQKAAAKMVFSRPLDIEDSSLVYFEVLEPSSLRYMYKSKPAKNFGIAFNQSYTSVELFTAEPFHACSRLMNEREVRGNSVLVLRGKCSFVSKALNAEQAGALFVIIADNDIGSTTIRIDMVHDETGRPVNIPTLLISGKDGEMIRRGLKQQNEHFGLINIPINLTTIPYHKRLHPPWTLI